jgi:hypothetical protein
MFEKAARLKLRFPFRGMITVEDLWDLPVNYLDQIYQVINRDLKGLKEDSLLEKKTGESEIMELQVSIIKHIVTRKVMEAREKEIALARREQARQIDTIIAKKESASLEEKSIDELKAIRDSL